MWIIIIDKFIIKKYYYYIYHKMKFYKFLRNTLLLGASPFIGSIGACFYFNPDLRANPSQLF